MNNPIILWTLQAENDMDAIYEYYFEKSPDAAAKVISDIINSAETLVFTDQFQIDEYRVDTRRIIIRNYKVLYTFEKEAVYILRVFDTRQSPLKM